MSNDFGPQTQLTPPWGKPFWAAARKTVEESRRLERLPPAQQAAAVKDISPSESLSIGPESCPLVVSHDGPEVEPASEEIIPEDPILEFSSDFDCAETDNNEAPTPSNTSIAAENIDIVSILETNQVHTVSEKYDLILLVAHESTLTELRVSKSILTHSSDKIEQLLSDRPTRWCTRDSRRIQYAYIQGHIDAILSILNILHFRSDDKLYNLEFDMVIHIAAVCESYYWYQSIYPWPRIWLDKYRNVATNPGYEDWLYISHVFRAAADERQDLLKLLSLQCQPSTGHSILRSGKPLSTTVWPQACLDEILNERLIKIINLLSTLRRVCQPLLDVNGKESKNICGDPICILIARGSLLDSLKEQDLWQFVEIEDAMLEQLLSIKKKLHARKMKTKKPTYLFLASRWKDSVQDLLERVKMVSFITLKERVPEHDCKMEGVLQELHDYEF